MAVKRKTDAPLADNLPEWLGGLLFKYPFEYTVDASPETIAAALQAAQIPHSSMFQRRMRAVHITPAADNRLTFIVEARRQGRGLYVTSAIARGVLLDEGPITVMRGYTRFALGHVLSLLLPVILNVMIVSWLVGAFWLSVIWSATVFMLLSFVAVSAVIWWQFTRISNERDEIRALLDDIAAGKVKPKRD